MCSLAHEQREKNMHWPIDQNIGIYLPKFGTQTLKDMEQISYARLYDAFSNHMLTLHINPA